LGLGDDSSAGTDASTSDGTTVTGQDSSTTDSGNPIGDAGADVRAEPSCSGIAYCENFEDYDDASTIANGKTLGPWTTNVGGTETMTVDGTNPYGGTKALHINIPIVDAGSSTSLLEQTVGGGLVTNGDMWGRMMVWYKNKPNGHTWLFQGLGHSSASGNNMSLNLANSGGNYFFNYHGYADAGEETSDQGGTPVAGAWVCLQWEYKSSGTVNQSEAKLWADGVLVIDSLAAPVQTWDLATPFTEMQLGFVHYPNTAEIIDVFIDDFALNNAKVDCPL
jgi:hypothetical protein